MGKSNRQRRAAKRRAETRRNHQPRGERWARQQAPGRIEDLVLAAAMAVTADDAEARDLIVDDLVQRSATPDAAGALSEVVAAELCRAVAACWLRGWQPADLVHVAGRDAGSAGRRVCADAVAIEAVAYAGATGADPGWLAQLASVAPEPLSLDRRTVLQRWCGADGRLREAVGAAVHVLGLLLSLPALPELSPPPRKWGRQPHRGVVSGCDPKITERVRALLAKAESTSFPEEAEALTAKAQELIAKHAIDRAVLEQGDDGPDVIGRRILLDDPYAAAKSLLVGAIARANHCKTVWSRDLGFTTVFGHPGNVDAVEMLHASLLTQATAAMVVASAAPIARGRVRSFRQSFLVAYAHRIGERLRGATAAAVDEARTTHGDALLPVLAARDEAVGAAVDAAYSNLQAHSVAVSNSAGWAAGRMAADLADLGPSGRLKAG